MLRSSTYMITLCTLLLLKSSISLKHSIGHHKFYPSIETKPVPAWESDNLRLMLDFIRESPEFRPLTFSLVLPEFQSSFVDFLLEYVRDNSIEAYKVRARDLSLKATWMERIHLTWIFVIHDLPSLNIFIYWQRELWKTRNQYLIVFTSYGFSTPWRDILRSLWKEYSVYRAIVISIDDDFGCLLRYMPFEVFENNFGDVHRLCLTRNSTEIAAEAELFNEPRRSRNLYDDNKSRSLNRNVKLFENFQNLNSYPLNVVVFDSLLMQVSYDEQKRVKLGKPDSNVLTTLEKAMGAKFRVKAMRKLDFKEDPFAWSLTNIESGNAEMVITGFFIKIYSRFQKYQFTCALYDDKVCFLAPDSGLVSKAYMPLLPFQTELWALLMLYNIVITLLWHFVKKISVSLRENRPVCCTLTSIKQPSRVAQMNNQFLNHYSLIARIPNKEIILPIANPGQLSKNSKVDTNRLNSSNCQGPPEIPRRVLRFFKFAELLCYPLQRSETPAQRALLFGTLFFGLIVNGVYQSFLVSSLSKPFHYPQINTIEDVIDSGKLVITRYANLKNVFSDDSLLDAKLMQRIHLVSSNNVRPTKDLVAYDNKISITRFYTMELGNFGYYDKEGNSLVYIVDECPMNYRVSYVLRLHSPYAEKVDFILLRFREAGLLSFWFENTMHPIRILKMRRKLEMEKKRNKLSLSHYSLTFLLLFVGLFTATIIFFGEVYIARRNKRKH